jgi:hypothetical protein
MKFTQRQLRRIINESVHAGEMMLLWNELQPGDLVDVDGEYNFYPKMRITQKLEDVSRESGLEPGPGFMGADEFGEEIVFSVEDVDPQSYQKYVFAEGRTLYEALTSQSSADEIAAEIIPLLQGKSWKGAAKLLMPIMSFHDIQLELDDGDLGHALGDAGLGWKEFEQLESAAWSMESDRQDASIAGDPDKGWLEFLANEWTSTITPEDLETLGWKEYKNYIRLSPPSSISHSMGELNISNNDLRDYAPGTKEEFLEFLETRASHQLGKRKPAYKSPPPYYD